MVNKSTPEERLKRYKEQLKKLAESENRDLKLTNPVKTKKVATLETQPSSSPPDTINLNPASPSPPQTLVSPSKRELRESMVVKSKSKREALVSKLSDKEGKNKIMLKARIKAIDSKLKDIKSRREMIELQYKRGMINRGDYEKRMKILVSEGQELLREKAEIDKALSH